MVGDACKHPAAQPDYTTVRGVGQCAVDAGVEPEQGRHRVAGDNDVAFPSEASHAVGCLVPMQPLLGQIIWTK